MFDTGDTAFKKLNTINRRMFIISAAKAVVFTGIITRLFSLQINENKKYLTLSDKNRLREWKLPPIRGEFLDYFGNIIAGNLEVYQLHVVPEQVENFKSLMIRLKEILKCRNVGISSGASAPEILVKEFIDKIKERADIEINEVKVVKENVVFRIPNKLT